MLYEHEERNHVMSENNGNTLYASLLAGTPEDAGLLDAWLDERSADRESCRHELPETIASVRQDNRRLSQASGNYDGDIAPGQIRILSKRFTADPDLIPYVAVLGKSEEGRWLVAPFSQYSYPATPGEMATGIRHYGLRVMQVWNVRAMQEPLIARSYLFGVLPDSVLQDGLALFRHEKEGAGLSDSFNSLRGGEITMEGDPRRDYLAETLSRLQPLSTAVKATERMQEQAERLAQDMGQMFADKIAKARFLGEDSRLAAGTRMPCSGSYDVGGVALDVEFSPEADLVAMTFYDKDDNRCLDYDGYGLLGADREFLGTFRDGFIRVPAASVRDAFIIVDTDGNAVDIKEV